MKFQWIPPIGAYGNITFHFTAIPRIPSVYWLTFGKNQQVIYKFLNWCNFFLFDKGHHFSYLFIYLFILFLGCWWNSNKCGTNMLICIYQGRIWIFGNRNNGYSSMAYIKRKISTNMQKKNYFLKNLYLQYIKLFIQKFFFFYIRNKLCNEDQ